MTSFIKTLHGKFMIIQVQRGCAMSKSNNAMAQHIVPQAHLKRFVDRNGMLWVYRKNGKETKSYLAIPRKVCKKKNYYDEFPYDKDSLETFIKDIEDQGQFAIDSILRGECDMENSDSLKKYVCNILERHEASRTSIRRLFNNVGVVLNEDDFRTLHADAIKHSGEEYLGKRYTEFHCFTRSVPESLYLLTSDVPITVIGSCNPSSLDVVSNYTMPKTIVELNKKPQDSIVAAIRDLVWAMPLTPNVCLFIVDSNNSSYEDCVPEPLGISWVNKINSMMVLHCIEEVYSDRDSKGLILKSR